MATPSKARPPSDETAFLWRAVKDLSPEELSQLWRFAAWRLKALGPRATSRTPDDLLQEAIVRIAQGVRILPEGLSLKVALIGVMRSIASAWGQSPQHDPLLPMEASSDDEHSKETVYGVVSITPERITSARERLARIHAAFQNDPDGLTIIKRMELGMTGPEIQRSMPLSEKEFRAAQKRVYRMLSKLEGLDA